MPPAEKIHAGKALSTRSASHLLHKVYENRMSTTTDPDDKNAIINEFIADPDASSILRKTVRDLQEDVTKSISDDDEVQAENAKGDPPTLRIVREST